MQHQRRRILPTFYQVLDNQTIQNKIYNKSQNVKTKHTPPEYQLLDLTPNKT